MNYPAQIGNENAPIFDYHASHISVKFVELLIKIERRSSKELEKEPKFFKNGDALMVNVTPSKPMVVKTFSEYLSFGHFVVRDMCQNVIVDVIKSIKKRDQAGAKSDHEVKSVEMHYESPSKALPDDNVGFNVNQGFLEFDSQRKHQC
ncbi:hypothetical protein V6N13_073729 [Hibiscus sabdariffa]